MSSSEAFSFYWHDYETFGADTARDRPVQFAGLRTNAALEPVGEPLILYARPTDDYLPHPQACLITGITPQHAAAEGLPEAEFIARIHSELAAPGTCGVGYNSLRFDDEVTRHTLYRNFFDPYAREWQHGNSRWDLIDLLRAACALRPEGITWPRRDDGLPSFKLEALTAANGIEHSAAHDALADVQATLAMARLVRRAQPRLYDFVLGLRDKHRARSLLDLQSLQPIVHISGKFGAARHNLGVIAPLLQHPRNRNEILCADLGKDPAPLIDNDPETVRGLLYTRIDDLPPDTPRPGLKSVHLNRCPVLAPLKVLDEATAARLGVDLPQCLAHQAQLLAWRDADPAAFKAHLVAICAPPTAGAAHFGVDVDCALYSGGFFSDHDRRLMQKIQSTPAPELAALQLPFEDARLPEMLLRYRARNYPQTLTAEEQRLWQVFRQRRLRGEDSSGALDIEGFNAAMREARAASGNNPRAQAILDALQTHADTLLA